MRKSAEFVDERYTGLFLQELAELVTMAEDTVNQEGWEILVDARTHLANGIMDAADVQAWEILSELQHCIANKTDDLCMNCGEMEGLHCTVFPGVEPYCRKQSLFSGDQRLSYRFVRATEGN